MTCGGCEKAVAQTMRKQLGEDADVEADARSSEACASASAAPQNRPSGTRMTAQPMLTVWS